jgi:hypothetical protein
VILVHPSLDLKSLQMSSAIVFVVVESKKSFISVRMISFVYKFARSNPFPYLLLQLSYPCPLTLIQVLLSSPRI